MTESNLDAPKATEEGMANPFKPYEPPPETKPIPSQAEIKAADDKAPKIDHFAAIAELVSGLEYTTPSGANTIGSKIMYHLNAIQDPKAFDKAQAEKHEADKKAAEEAAKQTKAAKEGAKAA